MNRLVLSILVFMLMFNALACNLPGLNSTPANTGNKPSVTISNPAANAQLAAGQAITVTSASIDPASAVARVELVVDGQVVYVDANANPNPGQPFIVAQPWTPSGPGPHTMQVKAYNQNNASGESAALPVQVVAAQAALTPTAAATKVGALTVAETTPAVTAVSTPTAAPTPTFPPAPALPGPTATINLTPTATPAPQKFSPTGFKPEGQFKDIWLELDAGNSRLGYPLGPEIADRNYAQQRFERGLMFWWDNPETPDYIWVISSPAEDLSSGKTSNLYADTWQEAQGEYACPAANNGGPIRGFGKVWCNHPELQTRLGKPVEPERGSGGLPPFARVQFFQGGVMVYNPVGNEAFVLFAQGDWLRIDYNN